MWMVFVTLLILPLPLSVQAEYLGDLSTNPFDSDSTANPFGAGSPFKPDGINNPFAPTAVPSATNPRRICSPPTRHGSMTSREIIVAS